MTDTEKMESDLENLTIDKPYSLIAVFRRFLDKGYIEPYQLDFFIVWLWQKGRPDNPKFLLDMPYYKDLEYWSITRNY